jgi:NAD(P)-dependent dehydrogenase (short-subunit alcohol dehydrogenase family)
MPGTSAYRATKAPLSSLTRSWAAEFSPAGVPVNSLIGGRPDTVVAATGTSRSVISWVQCLTKTERLGKSLFTAATGRRAVEHRAPVRFPLAKGIRPLGRQCHGPSSRHRVAGGRGCQGEACP